MCGGREKGQERCSRSRKRRRGRRRMREEGARGGGCGYGCVRRRNQTHRSVNGESGDASPPWWGEGKKPDAAAGTST
jgi:hypothetical protein